MRTSGRAVTHPGSRVREFHSYPRRVSGSLMASACCSVCPAHVMRSSPSAWTREVVILYPWGDPRDPGGGTGAEFVAVDREGNIYGGGAATATDPEVRAGEAVVRHDDVMISQRRSNMTRFCSTLFVFALLGAIVVQTQAPGEMVEWRFVGADQSHSKYSPADQRLLGWAPGGCQSLCRDTAGAERPDG